MGKIGLWQACLLCALFCAGCGGGGGGAPIPAEPRELHITEVTGIESGDLVKDPVKLAMAAEDDAAVIRTCIRIDNFEMATAAGPAVSYQWDVTRYKPGVHTVLFLAEDADGHRDTRAIAITIPLPSGEAPPEPVPPEPDPVEPNEPDPVIVPPEIPDTQDPDIGNWSFRPVPIAIVVDQAATMENMDKYEVAFPPMNPEQFDPLDTEEPKLYANLADGMRVWGVRKIEACSMDDTGVNAMAVAVNGEQIITVENFYINEEWDTRTLPDGPAEVWIFLRDNAGTIAVAVFHVEVANERDHTSPSFYVTELDDIRQAPTLLHGTFPLHVYAVDDSAVVWLKATMSLDYPTPIITREVAGDKLIMKFDSFAVEDGVPPQQVFRPLSVGYRLVLEARDAEGNTSRVVREVKTHNFCNVRPYVRAANGRLVDRSYAISFDASENRADADEYPHALSFEGFDNIAVPYGQRTLHVECEGHQAAFTTQLKAGYFGSLIAPESWARFDALHGPARSTRRIGIVTGANDQCQAYLPMLQADPASMLSRLKLEPGELELICGKNAVGSMEPCFKDVLADPDELYSFATLVVLGGNSLQDELIANPGLLQNLKGWIEDGGRLVVTSDACLLLELMYPYTVDFELAAPVNATSIVVESVMYRKIPIHTYLHDYLDDYFPLTGESSEYRHFFTAPAAWPYVLREVRQHPLLHWVLPVYFPVWQYNAPQELGIQELPVELGSAIAVPFALAADEPKSLDYWGRVFDYLVFNED